MFLTSFVSFDNRQNSILGQSKGQTHSWIINQGTWVVLVVRVAMCHDRHCTYFFHDLTVNQQKLPGNVEICFHPLNKKNPKTEVHLLPTRWYSSWWGRFSKYNFQSIGYWNIRGNGFHEALTSRCLISTRGKSLIECNWQEIRNYRADERLDLWIFLHHFIIE